ncbi:MAG: DUF5668 domain-containing protein [Acidobacteriota bacterium]
MSQPNGQPSAPRERFLDDPRRKSPLVAAVLSAVPGLGQVYVGYYLQGFVHILAIVGMLSLLGIRAIHPDVEPPLGFFIAFVWLYNVIDAARRASLYNQALSGLRPMDLPEDSKAPFRLGSRAGGVALVVVGLVFLSNTLFGISLDWIEQWWPMALVGAGAWLIYEDRRGRSDQPAGGDDRPPALL